MKHSTIQIAGFHFRHGQIPSSLELVGHCHRTRLPTEKFMSIPVPSCSVDALKKLLLRASPTVIPVDSVDEDLKCQNHGLFRYDGIGSFGPEQPFIHLWFPEETQIVDDQLSHLLPTTTLQSVQSVQSVPVVMKEQWNMPVVKGPDIQWSTGGHQQWTLLLVRLMVVIITISRYQSHRSRNRTSHRIGDPHSRGNSGRWIRRTRTIANDGRQRRMCSVGNPISRRVRRRAVWMLQCWPFMYLV